MSTESINHRDTPSPETHHYYTCWPFPWGGWLCGVSLIAIGGGLVLQDMFPRAGEAVWGLVLILLGAVMLFAAAREQH